MADNNSVMEWGDSSKVLVFVHYFGGSAGSWQWVAEKLKNTFRCISITLPGFGGIPALPTPSIQHYAEYVQHQLKLLGINNYHLIGHSMGGKIAMQLAADAADGTVKQLILIAPSPPSTEPVSKEEKQSMLKLPNRNEAEETIAQITKKPLSKYQYNLAVQNQLEVDITSRQWWVSKGVDHSIVNSLQSLKLPITILVSEDDPAISADLVREKVMSVFSQARLITIRKAGHLLPMEEAEWVADNIRSIVSDLLKNIGDSLV